MNLESLVVAGAGFPNVAGVGAAFPLSCAAGGSWSECVCIFSVTKY